MLICCGHYLTVTVSVASQFLLSAYTEQYYIVSEDGATVNDEVRRFLKELVMA